MTLNTITMKAKYPILVIDEHQDEHRGANSTPNWIYAQDTTKSVRKKKHSKRQPFEDIRDIMR